MEGCNNDGSVSSYNRLLAHTIVAPRDVTLWLCFFFSDNTQPTDAQTNNHDFVMRSWDIPTICDVCRKLLRGVFYQGYQCQSTFVLYKTRSDSCMSIFVKF